MVHLIFPISIRSALHAVLIALAFQVQAGGSNVTAARADENSETLYPGRYAANCRPTPIVGCTCEADSEGQTPRLLESASESNDHKSHIQHIEYLRMVDWLRLTCTAVTQSGRLR
jgi:hypothetical protein